MEHGRMRSLFSIIGNFGYMYKPFNVEISRPTIVHGTPGSRLQAKGKHTEKEPGEK